MTKEKQSKVKKGEVISNKMDKTVIIKIDRVKSHPVYKKNYIVSNNIKAHDENNEYQVGDIVEIVETMPISRSKFFKVIRSVSAKGASLDGKVK